MNRVMIVGCIILVMCMLAGCANHTKPAPTVESGDPVRQLNPTKWVATQADLATPSYFGEANGH